MQYVNEAYRNEMSTPYRGASYVYAYIGLINGDAQKSAKITSSFSGDESQLYDNASTTYAGVTSTEANGSITFTFQDLYELNIAGLTIVFNTKPDSITVTNGAKTKTYIVDSVDFSFDDGYTNCHYLTITPNSGKLSIKSILFGIGIQFTNRQILSTSRQNKVSHISAELPTKKFTLTVNNRTQLFNKDNPYGYAPYLEERQVITYDYGRELANGDIYKIKGGKVLLKNWTSDDYEATFSCVGYLDFMDSMYEKGKEYPNGITAYDLAVDIFQDAGVTNYKLDNSLKKTIIHNPIPSCEHREALKMLANASLCTLLEDRDGNICIQSTQKPSTVGRVSFSGATSYSTPSALFDMNTNYNYADAEAQYTYADGALLFLPDGDASVLPVGFVSEEIANSQGRFTTNPSVVIEFQSEYKLKQMIMTFGVTAPLTMQVKTYLNNTIVDNRSISSPPLVATYQNTATIDKIEIEFTSANVNQRIHLNHVELEGGVEYLLTYHELKNTPTASSLERVSNIKVHSYSYNSVKSDDGGAVNQRVVIDTIPNDEGNTLNITTTDSPYSGSISTIHATVGTNHVTFTDPYTNYKVSSGTIVDSGTYFLDVNSPVEQDIDIFGEALNLADNIQTLKVHEKGVEKNSTNPLIDSLEMAKKQAEWLREYYDDDVEYSLTYRGDPVLDADDLIYLENHFVANNEIRIEEETINTSLGVDFSCRLQGRRSSYQVDATLAKAIVGKFRLGEVL